MGFNLLYDVKLIDSINKYVKNAYSVVVNNQNVGNKSILDSSNVNASFIAQEKEKLNALLSSLSNKELEILEKESSFIKKIQETNEKLISVDKKYKKISENITFSGISNENHEYLLALLHEDSEIKYKSIEPIAEFFHNSSYPYISKPVSPIVVMSKKRKDIYEKLASCILFIYIINDENKQIIAKYIEEKKNDESLSSADRISLSNEENARTQQNIRQNILDDTAFMFDEIRKGLDSIVGSTFNGNFNTLMESYDEKAGRVPSNTEFPETVYLGDIAWKADNSIKYFLQDQEIKKTFANIYQDGMMFLPWELELGETQNLLFTYDNEKDKSTCLNEINKVLFRFMEQIPVNELEFTIFDPTEKGNSVYPFLSLSSQLDFLFSKKIFTSSEEIDAKMSELNNYVDSVIQQKLSNKYSNIFEYNNATPENPLPIRVVVLFDFPKYIEGRSLEKLVGIASNAYRAGIFIILCLNPYEIKDSFAGSYTKAFNEISDLSITLSVKNNTLFLSGRNAPVSFPDLPNSQSIDEFGNEYFELAKKKSSVGVSFSSICDANSLFTMSTKNLLSIPVGKGDGSVVKSIEFGKLSSQHALITGATGSGKSTLLHTIIMSALLNYSPDEVNLYLMDFKSGTEFKIYESVPVPHIKLLALDAMQEFGESILEELIEEQKRRSVLFKENGECTNIKSYIEKTGKHLPRILVVMDEFQILFNDSSNRKVANHCAELANKIVTEGRAFGIHLIMATQTLRSIREHSAIQSSTIEQMRIRIGLKCNAEDASLVFGENNSSDALMHMKGAIGTAVCNQEYTELTNFAFRTAYCPANEQKQLLERIKSECNQKWKCELRVFEGKREPEFPLEKAKNIPSNDVETVALIGEPIKIGSPITLTFSKRRPSNALIVGANAELTDKLQRSILTSLVNNKNVRTHYICGETFVGDDLANYITDLTQTGSKLDIIKDRKDTLLFIESLTNKLKMRKKGEDDKNTIHVTYIHNFALCDIIAGALAGDNIERSDYISDAFDYFDYGTSLKELIETGSSYGIFFVIDNPDYQAVQKSIQYGAGCMEKFPLRILFSISERDSDFLIGGTSTKELNSITAVFTDGLKAPLQFKPYKFN